MRINDFDISTARHIADFGSDFLLCSLVQPGASNIRAHIFHLPPGGRVGRHPATVGQAFCVVAGDGWVSGGDDERIPISTGQTAYWTDGEEHAAGTDSGLTAVVLEGDLRPVEPPAP